MARRKIDGNPDGTGSESIGDTVLDAGAVGNAPEENIRRDEESINGEIFDPGSLDSESGGSSEESGDAWFPKRNKKGRKPRANKEAASDLNGLLWMIHAGLSELTGVEEFMLDPKESEELSKSIARVQAFYPTSILSPIAMAWTGLIVTAGKIYGTRVIAYTAKKKRKPNVVEIPLPPGTVASTDISQSM